jgi:hypothetical protein
MEQGSHFACNDFSQGLNMLRSRGRRTESIESSPFGFRGTGLATTLLATLALVGCGSGGGDKPTAHLSGKVTIDGQPLPTGARGNITFRSTVPGQANPSGAEITDSEFDCPDVPVGNVDVYIQIRQETGRMASEGGRSWPETRSLIAEKYNNAIAINVTGDDHSHDFELTSK